MDLLKNKLSGTLAVVSGAILAPIFMANAGGSGRVYGFADIAKFFVLIHAAIIILGLPMIGWERRRSDEHREGSLSALFQFTNQLHFFTLMMSGFLAGAVLARPIMKFDGALLAIPLSILSACVVLRWLSKR